jgi:hypothetical protein
MQPEIEALTMRIARLERANRWMKVIAVGSALAAAGLVLMGSSGKPRTIEAEKVVILDSHRRPRITIGTPEIVGVAVGMKRDEPAIWLSDENGSDRTILASDGLYLADGRAKPKVSLTSGPVRPELRLYGSDGKLAWTASAP